MRIATATAADLDDASALLGLQFHEHGIELTPERRRAALLGLVTDRSRGAVLIGYEPQPVAIAVLAFTWTLEHGGRVGWLEELFVVAHRRGGGVGGAMLRRVLEVAVDAGCQAIDLEVDVEHERAEHLYEREGFRRLPRRRWTKPLPGTGP
jgi:GNAT superfamily N-acetyltransferase